MRRIFEYLKTHYFSSRVLVLMTLIAVFFSVLVARLFVLQIVRGQDYQDNYDLLIEKQVSIPSTRGLIFDRNGNPLAYNELAYDITIEDSGTYNSIREKNDTLNAALARLIFALERNGDRDRLINRFGIRINDAGEYEFAVTGSALNRFRADIFGRRTSSELVYNQRYEIDERVASAEEIMAYLTGPNRYNIKESYESAGSTLLIDRYTAYEIAIIRYTMSLNAYQKYIAATIATGISEKSVAYIYENHSFLPGISVQESYVRRYTDPYVFSSLIGYTGTISTEEYNERIASDDTVSLTDQVGKTGIEKAMDAYLCGRKGRETVYADTVGNPLLVVDHVDPVSGNNIYTSVDAALSQTIYSLLEREVAGVMLARLRNIREYQNDASSDELSSREVISIYDLYVSLINNHVLNTNQMAFDTATDVERGILDAFGMHKYAALQELSRQLSDPYGTPYDRQPDEYQRYDTYIVTLLKSAGVFDSGKIDAADEMQVRWTNEELSVNEYLRYVIHEGWIDVSGLTENTAFADESESYAALIDYVLALLADDSGFDALVYEFAIKNDEISGAQLCAALIDQKVTEDRGNERNALLTGAVTAYSFLSGRIRSLELTPAQLGLNLCSASTVVLDVNTGETLACVSYPGYDTNRLVTAQDSSYYVYLATNSSNPFYNYATQQRTAPGSTLKLMVSAAALTEGVISPTDIIVDEGEFEKISNKPKCWFYPHNHGEETMAEALRDSCNFYFYEVGYRMSTDEAGEYSDQKGIATLEKYANLFGLNEETGVEIEENTSRFATQYPVMASIGQSDNNITTIALARYTAAIANSGTVYRLTLLDHMTDASGNVIESWSPTVRNTVDVLNSTGWNTIHSGMRMMVEDMDEFEGCPVAIAGKTGTAQSSQTRASHALFVGYAPYDAPQIALATRIAYGYNSHYAAEVGRQIMEAYFSDSPNAGSEEDLQHAASVTQTLSGD